MNCPACNTPDAYQGLGKPECVNARCEFYKARSGAEPSEHGPTFDELIRLAYVPFDVPREFREAIIREAVRLLSKP